MRKTPFAAGCLALFLAGVTALAGCSQNSAAPASAAPPAASSATWFVPEGSSLSASLVSTLFDTNQLYINVPSPANASGEIRGQIAPSLSYQTDDGDPFAPNPANNPVTFATILGGDQVRPRNVLSSANGYGSLTVDPQTGQLTGFIVTSGISGIAAQLRDGLPGAAGDTLVSLQGGPVLWSVPANTILSGAQIARLAAGACYFEVDSDVFPSGEIRGQLDKQLRAASLKGANELPPVVSGASGAGVLALKQSTRQFSGMVKPRGFTSAITSVTLRIGAAGSSGIAIANLVDRGGGLWSLPADTVLGDAQVASFNNDELYFEISTAVNGNGEVRGQLLKPQIRFATAQLSGSNAVPPVSGQGSGVGSFAWNSASEQLSGSVTTDGFIATATRLQQGSAASTGPSLLELSQNSPVTGVPTPGISFALDVQPILSANCTALFCHVRGGIAPMSLEPGLAYANLIFLVVPGNSSSSYLVSRLTGAFPPQMPLRRPPLGTGNMDLIKGWIDAGALDN